MKKKLVSIVYDRRKYVPSKGKGLIEVLIYLSREQRKFIPVRYVTPLEYDQFLASSEAAILQRKYERVLDSMELYDKPKTIEAFNECLKEVGLASCEKPKSLTPSVPKKSKTSFIDFFHDELASERIEIRTRQAREVVFKSLLTFGRIQAFEDLTPANILEYHKWLNADGERNETTVKSYHKRLHRYVIKAYEYGYIDRDPYKAVTIPTGHSAERRPLSEEEINKLRSLQLRGKEEKARDLFIFSCFTGLCYCDAQAFDFGTMVEKIGDLYYIDGSRIKTGTSFFTPILPPAMEVLRMYNFRLPRLSNQKYNDFLHLIEARLQLNKPLTTHLARHTFATLVLSHDVPIEDLARMLGHKDVRTTQIYAKVLKKTITRHAEDLSKYFRA